MFAKTDDVAALNALTERINALETELADLKRAAARILLLESNLRALRQSRALLGGEPDRSLTAPNGSGPRLFPGPRPSGQLPPPTKVVTPVSPIPASILTLMVLREAARPLHVGEIMQTLRARGCQASQATIVGSLARYVKLGKLQRVAESTYVIP